MDIKKSTPATPESRYESYSKECEADLDALRFSAAFEAVMDKYMTERITTLESKVIVPVDMGLLLPELDEAFYFPTKADLSNVRAMLIEGIDDRWALDIAFNVNNTRYTVTTEQDSVLIQTDNSEGGSIDYRLEKSFAPKLLATFISSAHKVSDLQHIKIFKENITPSEGGSIGSQLQNLGQLIGTTSSHTTAALPYDYGDRAILATYTETESIDASGLGASISLAWELFDASTEFNYSGQTERDKTSDLRFGSEAVNVSESLVPIDDFVFSKQVPLMFAGDSSLKSIDVDRTDPRWQRMAVIFMSTISKLMKEYRYLDQTED